MIKNLRIMANAYEDPIIKDSLRTVANDIKKCNGIKGRIKK